jgi:hypothetical protein
MAIKTSSRSLDSIPWISPSISPDIRCRIALCAKTALYLGVIVLCGLSIGCDSANTGLGGRFEGPSHLQFRCVEVADGVLRGRPLDSCGCIESTLDDSGARVVTRLSGEDCRQQQSQAKVVGYVASASQEQVGVINITKGSRAFNDLDRTIPGLTPLGLDGLITDIGVHPYGDFMMIVLGPQGLLSLVDDHDLLRPELNLDLGVGALSSLAMWPTEIAPLPEQNMGSFAYIVAPETDQVIEVDLDVLSLALNSALSGEEEIGETPADGGIVTVAEAITRAWRLTDITGVSITPGLVSVDTERRWLVVSHARSSALSVIDLRDDDAPRREVSLSAQSGCNDGYLTRVLPEIDASNTCIDGIDNNGDGVSDGLDEMCAQLNLEALNPECPTYSECADGADNDEDGLIDDLDADCALEEITSACQAQLSSSGSMDSAETLTTCLLRGLRWEGAPPACDDGLDNDEDGLIDRADTGCLNERDIQEEESPERSTCLDEIDNDGDGLIDLKDEDCVLPDRRDQRPQYPSEGMELADLDPCLDGLDNDRDGLIDGQDPGCTDLLASAHYAIERPPQCADQIDNDSDGLIDYGPDGDPQCVSASDSSEASPRLRVGPTLLHTTTLHLPEGERAYAYTTTLSGALVSIDLDDPALPRRSISNGVRPLAFEVRQLDALAHLWVLNLDKSLSAIQLTGPRPLLTSLGAAIYVTGERTSVESESETSRDVIEAQGFYWIDEGVAYATEVLDPWIGKISIDPFTGVPQLPLEALDALSALEPDELISAAAFPLNDGGRGDLQVYVEGGYPLILKEWNNYREAYTQANRVVNTPSLSFSEIPAQLNPERHVGFCRSDHTERATEEPVDPLNASCVLIGDHPDGRSESEIERLERLSAHLEGYEGVTVTQPNPNRIAGGRYHVSYEGEIPNTSSRSGYMFSGDEAQWSVVDYSQDYCARGVEVGDLFVADRFYPLDEAAARSEKCAPYLTRSPTEGADPLRYRVSEVTPHRLTLIVDTREDYEPMLPPRAESTLPKLAQPRLPPPYECVAQAFSYQLKAGEGQWVVSTDALGFRHPWINRGGECVRDATRVARGRVGRFRLGETYRNEWVRFTLGFRRELLSSSGIPEGQLPFMIGAHFEFTVSRGLSTTTAASGAVLPTQLRWLPEIDRLYVVDTAFERVLEYSGVDPYLSAVQQVQEFD